ncbi:M48 family metallopeptidase [Bacteroides sp. 519]|uniref:tetratricopeptide repeat protein n=1 Tax=Bacteroides sp. 519 TaxID=2302937 RepID=UPI0013D892B2|nr:tetratricopeptide repeat protein [Bacteroides sp. 519]NDV58709.1 hypothetical protein [Bacteroides sp. 519]
MRYYILSLFCLFAVVASAQSLDEARKMFLKGEYAQAKPVFKRYVKSQPANANYNYWYGVCALETGELDEAVPFLEMAHKRKIQNAPLHLGKAYNKIYRFDEAIKMYEEYIDGLQKRKQPTDEVVSLLEKTKQHARMIKGVEEVVVVDSFVVDKKDFLQAYKISEESGSLHTYNEFFKTPGDNQGTVYQTELRNKLYYGETEEDGTLSIYSKNKMLDEWGKGHPLPSSINANANTNYPFVLTDGITIYYASDCENSIGGYDIFVTRYNTGTETYLNPENVGMPFNSPFNDYMYVIDEYNNLGWFASDRYQPEDKVCIYVFIPNDSKRIYNYEGMESGKMRSLAQLRSIEDTWKNDDIVEEAKKRLQAAINQKPQEERNYDFEFIINDEVTYHTFSDFKVTLSKHLFGAYQQMLKDYKQQVDKLDSQRKWYAEASKADQENATPAILDLEKRVLEMAVEVELLEMKIRNEEIQTLKK